MSRFNKTLIGLLWLGMTQNLMAQEQTQLLFGDTHLHTSYSFDAYLNKNQSADPDTAYRWAKGMPVIHPYNRARVQIRTPLDFLVVSDHAELMGVIRAINIGTAELEDQGWWGNLKAWFAITMLNRAIEGDDGRAVFTRLLPVPAEVPGDDPVADPSNVMPGSTFGDTLATETTAWSEIVDSAETFNAPGEFTTFIGWEWSSIPTGANLHRVVFSPDGGDKAKQFVPYGSDQSQYPEDLWTWLEDTSERTGARFVAMPHNSNISKGYMFAETTLKGEPMTAEYARRRMHWEPVAEVTQTKGDSETLAKFSPDDEFADFETYTHYIQQTAEAYKPSKADYVRPALLTGLSLEQSIGVNPYQFGFIGSTDSHTGLSSPEENNFWGKMALDSTPETKRRAGIGDKNRGANGWSMSASGLAAVWAKDNTRDEIFAAFQRKEVYATTGPRLQVQVFAAWNFDAQILQATDFAAQGYQQGVPMGGMLSAATQSGEGQSPQLMIRAQKDPDNASLDRIQVIKGWVDGAGTQHERIFNVAWSGDRELDSQGKLPSVGNTVDLTSGAYDNSIGSDQLAALWTDPEFDPNQRAFYYVRVLQIPTPRHSLYDAIALQIEAPEEGPATLQERAYTSPIWYTPQ